MFPVNTHDFYGGGCSCCSGKGKHFMEEETVTMPVVDISFAPTKAFVGAFGEQEARKQGERFTQPSWAQKMAPPLTPQQQAAVSYIQDRVTAPPTNPLLTPREVIEQQAAESIPPAAFVVVGGIFLAGAAVGLLVAWRLGMLSTATFTSP